MPKSPVLDREAFYDTLKDGSLRMLDWNLVNTELGACIEPRTIMVERDAIVQVDVVDQSVNRLTPFNEDKFWDTFNSGGQQLPLDYLY